MNILVRTYPCVLHHSIQHQFLYSSGIRSPNNRFGPAHKRLNPCAHVRPARSMSLLHWHHHKTASRPLERLWLRLVCLQAFHQTLSSQETAVLQQVLCTVSYRSHRLLYYTTIYITTDHYRSHVTSSQPWVLPTKVDQKTLQTSLLWILSASPSRSWLQSLERRDKWDELGSQWYQSALAVQWHHQWCLCESHIGGYQTFHRTRPRPGWSTWSSHWYVEKRLLWLHLGLVHQDDAVLIPIRDGLGLGLDVLGWGDQTTSCLWWILVAFQEVRRLVAVVWAGWAVTLHLVFGLVAVSALLVYTLKLPGTRSWCCPVNSHLLEQSERPRPADSADRHQLLWISLN